VKLGAIYRHDECLVPRVWHAVSLWETTRGLLGRPALQADEGLLLHDCRLVHTVGMRYALDLAFIDGTGKVRKVVSKLAPLRMSGSFPACATLELAPGTLARIGLHEGDHVTWRETNA
jgi:uncharacterized membrane protein (UPF0127 family)